MGKASFPPGFRFSPTDVELVKYYLKRKVMGKRLPANVITEIDIYKYSPWDLPDKSGWRFGDLKWYFFCPREKKYASGARVNRATEAGYWKTSGKDRSVHYNSEVVGWIKTLIFHTGRPPHGERTDWVLHEYRLEDRGLADMGVPQESYVVCIIFQKEGPGPNNGAQYGAPFKEEEWTDDEVEICLDTVPQALEPDLVLLMGYNSSIDTSTDYRGSMCIGPLSESCISDVVPPSCNVRRSVSSNYVATEKRCVSANDDILPMFDCFVEESTFLINGKDKNKELDNLIHSVNANATQELDNMIHSGNTTATQDLDILIHSVNANATQELDNILHSGNTTATQDLDILIHSGNANATQELDNILHSGNTTATQGLDILIHSGNANATQELDNILHSGNANATAHLKRSDIYGDLGDLGNLGRVEDVYNLASGHSSLYTMDEIFELVDLDKPLNCDTYTHSPSSLV